MIVLGVNLKYDTLVRIVLRIVKIIKNRAFFLVGMRHKKSTVVVNSLFPSVSSILHGVISIFFESRIPGRFFTIL